MEFLTFEDNGFDSSFEGSPPPVSRSLSSSSLDEDVTHDDSDCWSPSSSDPARLPSRYMELFATDEYHNNTSLESPAPTPSRSLSPTSFDQNVMWGDESEGVTELPSLETSELESILQNELDMLREHPSEEEKLRLRKLLSILIGKVVAAGSKPLDGSRQLEGFVLIEKFYWKADSIYGIRLPLNELLHHICLIESSSSSRSVDDYGNSARQLARDFDGRFTSRIPWETIWWDHLLDPEGVNKLGQTRLPLHEVLVHQAFETSDLQTGAPLLLSLPTEIIRHILHLGAESLLPIVRSSLNDRRVLHQRRSHFLTNAALTHSIFRRQAQLELVSFAYCRTGDDLNGLLDFVHDEQISGSFTRIGIDFDFDEGENEGALGGSLVRLSHWTHPRLKSIDFGETLSSDTVSLFQNSLHLTTIKFTHFDFDPWARTPGHQYILSPSVINLDFDCCGWVNPHANFQTEFNILEITMTGHENKYLVTADELDLRPVLSTFPKVAHLSIDNTWDSYELLRLDFPSLSRLELSSPQNMENLVENFHFVLPLILNKPALELLILPEELCERLATEARFQLEEQGIVLRCTEV